MKAPHLSTPAKCWERGYEFYYIDKHFRFNVYKNSSYCGNLIPSQSKHHITLKTISSAVEVPIM